MPPLGTVPLAAVALGADGLLPDIEDGNHVRWQFDPALGFPQGGFDLFRRPHRPGSPFVLNLPTAATDVQLGATYRKLSFHLRLDGGPGPFFARYLGVTVLELMSSGGWGNDVVLGLEADAIDEVLLPLGTVIKDGVGVPAAQEADLHWGQPR